MTNRLFSEGVKSGESHQTEITPCEMSRTPTGTGQNITENPAVRCGALAEQTPSSLVTNPTLATILPFVAPKLELRKYVVYTLNGIERVILAEAPIEHVDMVPRSSRYEIEVVSAGFFTVTTHGGQAYVHVSGHSTSLDVSSRAVDAALIQQFLKGN